MVKYLLISQPGLSTNSAPALAQRGGFHPAAGFGDAVRARAWRVPAAPALRRGPRRRGGDGDEIGGYCGILWDIPSGKHTKSY